VLKNSTTQRDVTLMISEIARLNVKQSQLDRHHGGFPQST